LGRFITWKLPEKRPKKKINKLQNIYSEAIKLDDSFSLNIPELFASIEDIFHEFFYHQHAQSYHIADTANYHLSHSKRKLHIEISMTREKDSTSI